MEIENVDFNNNSVEALDQAEKAETGIIGVAVADEKGNVKGSHKKNKKKRVTPTTADADSKMKTSKKKTDKKKKNKKKKKKADGDVEVYHPEEIPTMVELENVDLNNSVEALDQAEKAETGIIGVAVADDKDDDSENLKPHRVALVVCCLGACKVLGVLVGIFLFTYVGRLWLRSGSF